MDWSTFSIGNAAGFIKGPGDAFEDLLRSATQEICVGSITLEERSGNPGNVHFVAPDGTSINSLGLPNPGLTKFVGFLPELWNKTRGANKRLRISIAGFEPTEYGKLAAAFCMRADIIEVNLGCPNVWAGSGQKPIAAFNTALSMNIISRVLMSVRGSGAKIAIKLSPYSDPETLTHMANMIKAHCANRVEEVVTANTFPNGLAFKDGTRAIDMPYGGIGGNAMRMIALGQVAQFAAALKNTGIRIIGVGGIERGSDLLAMKEAGASGIQVGTAFGEHQGKIFSDVLQEAVALAN